MVLRHDSKRTRLRQFNSFLWWPSWDSVQFPSSLCLNVLASFEGGWCRRTDGLTPGHLPYNSPTLLRQLLHFSPVFLNRILKYDWIWMLNNLKRAQYFLKVKVNQVISKMLSYLPPAPTGSTMISSAPLRLWKAVLRFPTVENENYCSNMRNYLAKYHSL